MQMILEAPVRKVTNRTIHRQATIVSGHLVPTAPIPAPVRVRIEPEEDGAFFLFRLDESGDCIADTWHRSLAEAKEQASFEYEIEKSDWVDVSPGAR